MKGYQNSIPTPIQPKDGGSGTVTLSAHGIIIAEGTSPYKAVTGTDGQILVFQTGADPLAKTASGDATLAASGAFTVISASTSFALSGVLSPSQITGDQNDYNPTGLSTASELRLNTDASHNITGLAGGAAGRILTIHNVGSFNFVLKNASASSSAANRFDIGADLTVTPSMMVFLQYDSTSSRWRAVSGGGGGGTVTSVATDATLTGGPITTTGTLGINLAHANTWTAAQTIQETALGSVVTGGVLLTNTTTATALAPDQLSPAAIFRGSEWNGSSGDTYDWAFAGSSTFSLYTQANSGGYNSIFQISFATSQLGCVIKNGLYTYYLDSATTSASVVHTFDHVSSGTPAAGFGETSLWRLQDTTSTSSAFDHTITWVTATHASRKARCVFNIYDTAAREAVRIEASGTVAEIGFLGANAVAQQTGDAGTALVTFGLMSGTPTFAGANVTGTVASATALQNARTLWGQSFDGTANVSGSLTAVGNITGGASSMTITAGTGNSRTLTLQTTTSGGTATTAILIGADQSTTFSGTLTGSAGAFALSFGSFTGDTTLPTGNVSWTGASTKTVSVVSNGGAITITAGAASTWSTSSGTLNIDSAAALNLGPTNTTSVVVGNSAHCTKISFTTTTGGNIAFPSTTPMLLGVGGRLSPTVNFVETADQTGILVLKWNAGGPNGDRLPVFDGTTYWNLFQSGQLTIKSTDSAQTGGSISGTTITGLTSTAQLVPGMKLSNSTGTGTLAANTTISTITSATAITVNNAASVNGTLTNLTFKLPASTAYDVILVNDAGTLRLLWGPAWATSTGSSAARSASAALTTQNGIEVNLGAWTTGWTNTSATVATLTGTYLGSLLVSATDGQISDSHNYRGIWNNYNRRPRQLYSRSTGTTRVMASTTPEFFMNDSTQAMTVMVGLSEDIVKLDFGCMALSVGAVDNPVIGIGVDSTSAISSTTIQTFGGSTGSFSLYISARYYDWPGIGGHTFNLLERSGAGGSVTFVANNSVGGMVGVGCVGEVWA